MRECRTDSRSGHISSQPTNQDDETNTVFHSAHGSLQPQVNCIVKASGNILFLSDRRRIFDAVGGAAVTSIGHGGPRVKAAVGEQIESVEYCRSTLFTTKASADLAAKLVTTTGGVMSRALLLTSGTDAIDAALKLSILHFRSLGQPQRTRFIAREGSYHGSSVSAISLGHHKRRRQIFQGLLALDGPNISHVSRAHAFRDSPDEETTEAYVARLARELDQHFQQLGPETVCAFVAEPIVGSGLGGAVAPKGYFKAVKSVCQKYGALLILDEVMCGLGRTGSYHAWQDPDVGVSPDLQAVGKTLAGGYIPAAALLIGNTIATSMEARKEYFVHGATYEDHPVAAAAALCVQQIVQREALVENCRTMGELLQSRLMQHIAPHPCICDVRGKGLFYGIEIARPFVKESYPSRLRIAYRIRDAALRLPWGARVSLGIDGMSLFPMQGCADGLEGDVIMLMPAFNISAGDVDKIVRAFAIAIQMVLGKEGELLRPELVSSTL